MDIAQTIAAPKNQVIPWLKGLGYVLAAVIIAILVVGLIPTGHNHLVSQPAPAQSYADAVSQYEVLNQAELPVINEYGSSLLMTHRQKTAKAYVFIHGTTNSPHQFEELGEMFYDKGYNVLILRMPYHGLASHSVSELKVLKGEDLRRYADQAVNIGSALGDELVVVGLSGGGLVTAWIAQNRPEVDTALMVAPFFGIADIPHFVDDMYINLFGRIPNMNFIDPDEPLRGWTYSGESSRGVAAFMLLSKQVYRQALVSEPKAGRLFIITTASDTNVNNDLTDEIAEHWRASGADLSTFEFERSMNIPHNSIDPTANITVRQAIYQKIFEMLGEGSPPPLNQ